MNISDILSKVPKGPKRNRVGRGEGSGNGGTSGRGHNGAHSRSGWSRKLGFEGGQMPLARRLPKRGFGNKLFQTIYDVVNVGDLNEVFEDGETVTIEGVRDRLGMKCSHRRIKVLGEGGLTRKLSFSVQAVSASARQKIEANGGSIEIIATPPRTLRKQLAKKAAAALLAASNDEASKDEASKE
jgi:large subunit ribosomal protein L15